MRFQKTALVTLWTIAILSAIGLMAFMTVSGAQAQEVGNQTETPEQVEDELGELRINEYDYSNGEMVITATWRGDTPETVTLTELIELDSSGSTSISFQTVRLLPNDETEITIGVSERSGGTAAVLITQPQTTANGEGLVLQSGSPSSYPSISFDIVTLSIGLTAIGATVATFLVVVRNKRKENKSKERIL